MNGALFFMVESDGEAGWGIALPAENTDRTRNHEEKSCLGFRHTLPADVLKEGNIQTCEGESLSKASEPTVLPS
jgi:hypothetical protein